MNFGTKGKGHGENLYPKMMVAEEFVAWSFSVTLSKYKVSET